MRHDVIEARVAERANGVRRRALAEKEGLDMRTMAAFAIRHLGGSLLRLAARLDPPRYIVGSWPTGPQPIIRMGQMTRRASKD
jgi:hypothetical protein